MERSYARKWFKQERNISFKSYCFAIVVFPRTTRSTQFLFRTYWDWHHPIDSWNRGLCNIMDTHRLFASYRVMDMAIS